MLFSKKIAYCLLPFALASCGFEPLYVERSQDEGWYYNGKFDTSITDEMALIEVAPISDRLGQMLRNELLDSFTPKGQPQVPAYRLRVDDIQKEVVLQALRDDITATRERVKYTINYTLYDAQSNKELVHGDSLVYLSYDILSNPYSTTFAQKKAEKNAARILANDISLRLGAYFHSTKTKRGNPNEF